MTNLDYGLVNIKGKNKHRNEDYHLIASRFIPGTHERVTVVAISDGMGGHDHADQASHIAIKALEDLWAECFEHQDEKITLYGVISEFENKLPNVLDSVDEQLISLEETKMGTTLSVLLLAEKYYYIAHVGDGRIYKLNSNLEENSFVTEDLEKGPSALQLTEDHSWINLQIKRGKLNEDEALNHKNSSLIYECLGVRRGVNPFYTFGSYTDNEVFVLMTDGVYKNLRTSDITQIFKDELLKGTKLQDVVDIILSKIQNTAFDDDICLIAISV